MPQLTRRTLLQTGSAALSGAALVPAGEPQSSPLPAAADQDFFHVFAFHWKEGTSDAQKERARKEISAFQGVIPGLQETHVGRNLSEKGGDYTFGGVMRFRNRAAFEAYTTHPAHKTLLVWLVSLIDAIELDLDA